MKTELIKRIQMCWKLLADAIEEGSIDSSMLIATMKYRKKKIQVQIKFTTDEYDFIDTNHGEVKL